MTLVERLAAARNPAEGSDRWEFSEIEVSGFFTFCLTDVWHLRVQAEYYDSFWESVLTELSSHQNPVEIRLKVDYTYGNESEETIKQYMRQAVDLVPGFMAVREPEGDASVPSFVHMHYKDFEVTPLEITVDVVDD